MQRILHIVGTMNIGGQEVFIMNAYKNIDRTKYQFDFIVHTQEKMYYEDEIIKLGGIIHRVPRKTKKPISNYLQIKRIVKENNYKIIHRHTSSSFYSYIDLLAAKKGGAKVLISHSHSTTDSFKLLHNIFRPFNNKITTKRLSCGEDAGTWLYNKKSFTVLNNGINLTNFNFSLEERIKIRADFNILEDTKVIVHVGRFNKIKNHDFIIDIFNEINQINNNSKLFLVGVGEEQEAIISKVNEKGLAEKVIFFGARNDVSSILSASDLFLFPSIKEGIPLTLIETQANGLKILMSDSIDKNVILSDLVTALSLKNNAKEWSMEAIRILSSMNDRSNISKLLEKYDIKKVSKQLENIYNEEYNKEVTL